MAFNDDVVADDDQRVMTTLDKGVRLAQQATQADAAREYATALNLYQQALDYMVVAMKHERNAAVQAKIEVRIREYLARAEALKAALEQRAAPIAATGRGGGGGGGGGHDGDADADGPLASVIVRETPNVSWSDVVGLENAKTVLQETVILPLRHPQLFYGSRQPWRGILLYGPPGTGKSYLAKAVATEAESTFFSVSASDLTSKWFGESEKLVRELFDAARGARPSIVFIDEIDSLCGERTDSEHDASRRLKTELLVQMDGVGHDDTGVLVLGATNTPWNLDPAMRRRFEKRIYIALPAAPERARIARLKLEGMQHTLTADDFERIGAASPGYSGADMNIVVRDAIMQPVRTMLRATHFVEDAAGDGAFTPVAADAEGSRAMHWKDVPASRLRDLPVTAADFSSALAAVKPSVAAGDVARYEHFTTEYGVDGG